MCDWVRLAVERARATGAPAVFWLDETRAHDARAPEEGPRVPRRARHRRPADRDPARGRGDPVHARARRARRGHDLGHRQRAARLPDRPVPDPRARHEREDALDRPADERRRAVRDRRRGLGAQARPAARAREPPALGLAGRVPRARGLAGDPGREATPTRRRSCSRTRSTERPGRCWRTGSPRRARWASSTTAAATSTSRCTGRRRWPSQTDDPALAAAFAPARRAAGGRRGDDRRGAQPRRRARTSTSAATTSSTATRPTRSCARAARSTA